MNKTNLLRRYHWLWAGLPIVSALGTYAFLVAVEKNWISLPSWGLPTVDVALSVLPIVWVALTAVCSTATALLRCEQTQLRGVIRIAAVIVVALMITVAQVLVCIVLLGTLPGLAGRS